MIYRNVDVYIGYDTISCHVINDDGKMIGIVVDPENFKDEILPGSIVELDWSNPEADLRFLEKRLATAKVVDDKVQWLYLKLVKDQQPIQTELSE